MPSTPGLCLSARGCTNVHPTSVCRASTQSSTSGSDTRPSIPHPHHQEIFPDSLDWVMGILWAPLLLSHTSRCHSLNVTVSVPLEVESLYGAGLKLVLLGPQNQPRPQHKVSVKLC